MVKLEAATQAELRKQTFLMFGTYAQNTAILLGPAGSSPIPFTKAVFKGLRTLKTLITLDLSKEALESLAVRGRWVGPSDMD